VTALNRKYVGGLDYGADGDKDTEGEHERQLKLCLEIDGHLQEQWNW